MSLGRVIIYRVIAGSSRIWVSVYRVIQINGLANTDIILKKVGLPSDNMVWDKVGWADRVKDDIVNIRGLL